MTKYIKKTILYKDLGLFLELDIENEIANSVEISNNEGSILKLVDVKIKDLWNLQEILEIAGREIQSCEEIKLKEEKNEK